MNFIVIFGPSAVGKMAVGAELAEQTGYKLFHNHMTIELVLSVFDHGSPQFKLSDEFRQRVFEEAAKSDLDGLIFTFVWALDIDSDKQYMDRVSALFQSRGAKVCFAELYANQATRLDRNKTELRLQNKPSKRELAESDQRLIKMDSEHRLNSRGDFYYPDQHLYIDNTDLSASEAARRIARHFDFPLH